MEVGSYPADELALCLMSRAHFLHIGVILAGTYWTTAEGIHISECTLVFINTAEKDYLITKASAPNAYLHPLSHHYKMVMQGTFPSLPELDIPKPDPTVPPADITADKQKQREELAKLQPGLNLCPCGSPEYNYKEEDLPARQRPQRHGKKITPQVHLPSSSGEEASSDDTVIDFPTKVCDQRKKLAKFCVTGTTCLRGRKVQKVIYLCKFCELTFLTSLLDMHAHAKYAEVFFSYTQCLKLYLS